MTYHQALRDIFEDQLSLASIHYLRSHYQEAIDIYKRILLDNRQVTLTHVTPETRVIGVKSVSAIRVL